MRASVLVLAAVACAGCSSWREPAPREEAAPVEAAPAPAAPTTEVALESLTAPPVWEDFTFEKDAAGSPPARFTQGRTGMGRPSRWVVREAEGAPSGSRVLAQVDADPTDYRFPVAVADAPVARDARVSAKVRMVSGEVDRAAGLVLRFTDADNYYVARANALENNVMLFFVKDGKRIAIGVWNGPVTAGEWHAFEAVVKGDHLLVRWDGLPVLDTRDATLTAPGRCGVWTKADAVTEFDDLRIEALGE